MKIQELSRRDFLKLASLVSFSSLLPRQTVPQSEKPNILVVVFDAWSAKNIELYGYPRQTMPKLSALADKAIVYHNHYAAGPWTVPGTASLLTGTYPWTHRCISMDQIQIVAPENNLFRLMKEAGYASVAATHNMYADSILSQFNRWLTLHPRFTEMFLPTRFPFTSLFRKDIEVTALAQQMVMWNAQPGHQSSIFLGDFFKKLIRANLDRINQEYRDQFPEGVPQIPVLDMPFLLEDGIDHLLSTSGAFVRPQLSYYHYYPPHQPYRTRSEFAGAFKHDGVSFPEKPLSHISEEKTHVHELISRQEYDAALLYVDAEFERLYQGLERSGKLENTWLVLTSDHGEMFERGNIGHETPMGYEPLVKVPLLIFPPGQKERIDIHTVTGAVDVLPTLLQLAGQPVPDWVEGVVLPPFSDPGNAPKRAVFSADGRTIKSKQPFSQGSVTMVRDGMKLIFTFEEDRLD
ncbi:MAG: sulfatase, partial [Anaerolineales bacterium]